MGTTVEVHPARSEPIERWLTERGVKWTFVHDLSLKLIDFDASLKNQARLDPLDHALVAKYAVCMARGDLFPAVVSFMHNEKFVMIDGNHRINAAQHAKATTYPSYVVKANAEQRQELIYEANRFNGRANSEQEALHHGLHLVRSGHRSTSEAASIVGVSYDMLLNHMSLTEANRRAKIAGIKGFNELSGTARRALNRLSNENVFRAAARVCVAKHPTMPNITTLLRIIKESPTEAEQLKNVARFEKEVTVPPKGKKTGHKGASPRVLLGAHLTYLAKVDVENVITSCLTDNQKRSLADQCMEVVDLLMEYAVKLTPDASSVAA